MNAAATHWMWACLAVLLAGCSVDLPRTSRLDSSGLTVVTNQEVIMLARPVRTLAAGARDFAYIGPVEINRMGRRDYYFWIGLASTVDRDLVGTLPEEAVALAVFVDDEPMILPLSVWDTSLDLPPYHATVPVYATLMAPTSLDQIHRIAAAKSVELHLIAGVDSAHRYRAWQAAWSTWSEFPNEN